MKYQDPVYGDVEITEPVLIELLSSSPLQRLKKIAQHGATVYNLNYTQRIITRFEHSLGVSLLLKKFDRSIEEQIAGLLHDVGHAVFSHVVDYLFAKESFDFDVQSHGSIIKKSEIPQILNKYGIDLDYILAESNFPVLEKELPDLCADRIDYFLRDGGLFAQINAERYLNAMQIKNDRIIFKNYDIALEFALKYMEMGSTFWADNFQEYLYMILVDILKRSLEKGIINLDDIHSTEDVIMDKINLANDTDIRDLLKLLSSASREEIEICLTENKSFYKVKNKARIVDPLFFDGKKIIRVTDINQDFRRTIDMFREKISQTRWIGRKI